MTAAVRPVGLYSVLVRQALLLPHLTEEETEAQRDHSRPPSSKRRNPDLNLAIWFCLWSW